MTSTCISWRLVVWTVSRVIVSYDVTHLTHTRGSVVCHETYLSRGPRNKLVVLIGCSSRPGFVRWLVHDLVLREITSYDNG